ARDRRARNARPVADEHRALSGTDGAGGDYVPPAYLVDQWVRLARAGRVVADQVTHQPLPAGTDTINLPRMVTGTATAAQASQNTAIQQTDATTDTIAANVETIAGGQTLSLQLVEQSPVAVDDLVLGDLLADLAVKVDTFTINNNAAGKRGMINVTGVNSITYTDATPTVGELYAKIADAVQQIHTGRFLPPSKIFMHPRRWAWLLAALDTQTRPLVVPVAQMPQNAIAAMGGVAAEGLVGSLQGLPVFVDPNLPTNLGAGTNEDRIVVTRAEDVILYESLPRAEVFREVLAAQMSIFVRVYEYAAIHAGRYPKSISVISGTGLVAPTF
ncbi:MAG: phage major capsid protein, partial [Pseudonocardia sp.]|nr:phage major capsid protein [Pseudonocardia sp.]